MSNRVNIPSHIQDPAYRYKMPRLVTAQESRLNGAKTNIKNLPDLAIALRVPDAAVLKWFCRELGANSEGTTIVKGVHQVADLATHLDKFIRRYVLCSKCNYPELIYSQAGKKNLVAKCNSCRNEMKLDAEHQAGKVILKEFAAMYEKNPDWLIKKGKGPVTDEDPSAVKKTSKKSKKAAAAAAADEAEEMNKKLNDENFEIDPLDATAVELGSPEIQDAIQSMVTLFGAEEKPSKDKILQELRHSTIMLNVTNDYKMFIFFSAAFHPTLLTTYEENWKANQLVFKDLLKENDKGVTHLFQSMVQFFVNHFPDQKPHASELALCLYNNSIIEDTFFNTWFEKKRKLDRDSILSDTKAEKAMRGLLTKFIEWLNSAEYDEEDYGEEETKEEAEEVKEEVVTESEGQKKQRLLMEAQQQAQKEALLKASQAKHEEPEKPQSAAATSTEVEDVAKKTDIAAIEVADDFDLDDI